MSARQTDLRLKGAQLASELTSLSGYGADGVSGAFNPTLHATWILEPLFQQRVKLEEDLAKAEKESKKRHPRVLELRAQVALVEARIREAIRPSRATSSRWTARKRRLRRSSSGLRPRWAMRRGS